MFFECSEAVSTYRSEVMSSASEEMEALYRPHIEHWSECVISRPRTLVMGSWGNPRGQIPVRVIRSIFRPVTCSNLA
jgi:hypothetical protein